ncbi:transcriptional regulator PpsR [Cognatiyoonia koreensis]|uniref:Transcriptional regulator PpsR n=1 Tax=Cognatiyoonia koreensis TaxID=364200 RepID=A0A1I0RQL7_9RHOB|nr:transcriptional regulator PpsR [Cognatiyoonia koreensis]SEW43659.1 transcriptional regulator PpsR [Cognatiyoonia koreensis]
MTSRGTKYWENGAIPLIAPDVLGGIISEVSDIGVVMTEKAEVLSVLINPNSLGYQRMEQLEGKQFQTSLSVESVPKFEERLAKFLDDAGPVRPLELNHSDPSQRFDYPVRYSFHRIGPDGAILLLGRDLRPVAEMQQQLVRAQLALERDYEQQREYDTRFRVLMESTSDAVIFVSTQSGQMTEMNKSAVALIGESHDSLVGQKLSDLFEGKGRDALIDQLAAHAIADSERAIALTLSNGGVKVLLYPTLFRAAGERFMLCRLHKDDPENRPLDSLATNVQALFARAPDAMVFATADGKMLSTNEAFLNLIGVAHDVNIRGRSFADYLLRGSVDLKVMIDNTGRSGRMRLYATKLAGDYGSPRNVEISVTRIEAGKEELYAFIIRDANRVEPGRPAAAPSEDNINSVIELVGSATLKEIVAETTNVVEKMCIETAVELTMNNRVAAAEMLGLSRQSLYVKLRKFDLLNRDSSG